MAKLKGGRTQYLGGSFNSPFNILINVFEYSNDKSTRSSGGGDIQASFVLPAPREFTTQIKSRIDEDVRAKEVGSVTAALGGGEDEVSSEIALGAFSEMLTRSYEDFSNAFNGVDAYRVMDSTESYYSKSEKRRFVLSWDILTEGRFDTLQVLKVFDNLTAYSLAEASSANKIFRVTPPYMASIQVCDASTAEDGAVTVSNNDELTDVWLSSPRLCLISSVTVKRDVTSIFPEKVPNNLVGIVELTEIEPMFRYKDGMSTRSQVIQGLAKDFGYIQ